MLDKAFRKKILVAVACLVIMIGAVVRFTTNSYSLDPFSETVATLKQAVENNRVKCADIVGFYLQRIKEIDPKLHAIVGVNPAAIDEARRIDMLTHSQKRALPLLCAPLLVKDNIDVSGMPTTAGSVVLRDNIARRNATAIASVKAAGGVVIAKTNMSEFAFNFRGLSSIAGQTRSPFSVDESAGGSSSGNAAALAAGLGVIALGTDTSGSVRVPAALTGTFGIRPTYGAFPLDGVLALSPSQDTLGPMCRWLADCKVLFRILSNPNEKDNAEHVPDDPLQGLSVGLLRSLVPEDTGRPAVAEALAVVTENGAVVTETRLRDQDVLTGATPPAGETATFASRSVFDFPDVMDAYLPTRANVPSNAADFLKAMQLSHDAGTTLTVTVDYVERFFENRDGAADDDRFRVNGAFRDQYVAERINEAFDCAENSKCFDVLLYASVQNLAASVEEGPQTDGTHRLAAYSGRPAIAFPIGIAFTSAGPRPVSLELLANPGDEWLLFAIVEAWEKKLPSLSIIDNAQPGAAIRFVPQ